jgi:transposase
MLTWEDELEVHALPKRGWSISAIVRHTGYDRKTVRKYLAPRRESGPGRHRIRTTVRRLRHRPGWSRIRICGPGHCSTSWRAFGVRAVVSQPDP